MIPPPTVFALEKTSMRFRHTVALALGAPYLIVASADAMGGDYDREFRELKAILATVTIRPTTVAVPPTQIKAR